MTHPPVPICDNQCYKMSVRMKMKRNPWLKQTHLTCDGGSEQRFIFFISVYMCTHCFRYFSTRLIYFLAWILWNHFCHCTFDLGQTPEMTPQRHLTMTMCVFSLRHTHTTRSTSVLWWIMNVFSVLVLMSSGFTFISLPVCVSNTALASVVTRFVF